MTIGLFWPRVEELEEGRFFAQRLRLKEDPKDRRRQSGLQGPHRAHQP